MTDVINFDPNTGQQLTPGQTVVNNQTGQTMTQGQTLSAQSLQNPVMPITLPTVPAPTPVQQFIAPPDTSGIYNDLLKSAGIDQKTTDVNTAHNAVTQEQANLDSINANLKGISDLGTQTNLNLESGASGKDVTSSFLGRQQQEVTRQTAIRALPFQSQALASQAKIASLQGNEQLAQNLLSQAQGHVDTLFKIQSTDAQNQYQYKQNQIDAVFNAATKDQQNKLDALKVKQSQDFQAQQDNLNSARSIATSLMATQPQLASQIMGLDPNSKTYTEDLAKLLSNVEVEPGIALDIQNKILQNKKLSAEIGKINSGVNSSGLSTISQAVIENPNLLSSLTPTVKGQVISELQGAGYDTTNLGTKPLSDTAIKEINQTDYALTSLSDLKSQIENNLEYIGPIKGLAALNPWSKAKQVQATIDRVKQTVGKALEGGVLREEDEEKYKKILATINDTPETATFKIDNLISSIQSNLQDYKTLQQSAGRSLDIKSSLQKKDTSAGKTSTGNSYTITKE